MKNSAFDDLKREFREWCGLLSIEEIMSNPPLIETICRIESILNRGEMNL